MHREARQQKNAAARAAQHLAPRALSQYTDKLGSAARPIPRVQRAMKEILP